MNAALKTDLVREDVATLAVDACGEFQDIGWVFGLGGVDDEVSNMVSGAVADEVGEVAGG